MNKKTVGAVSLEFAQKTPDSRDPIELEREMHRDYEENIHKAIEDGKNTIEGDFFITVITKKERLMKNVLRHYFLARKSCPSPDYDQTVYHYHRYDDRLEFLWVLPSKDTCVLFKDNMLQIDPKERELLNFILMDSCGELLALSKKLNGEVKDSTLLEKGN